MIFCVVRLELTDVPKVLAASIIIALMKEALNVSRSRSISTKLTN